MNMLSDARSKCDSPQALATQNGQVVCPSQIAYCIPSPPPHPTPKCMSVYAVGSILFKTFKQLTQFSYRYELRVYDRDTTDIHNHMTVYLLRLSTRKFFRNRCFLKSRYAEITSKLCLFLSCFSWITKCWHCDAIKYW